jgi:Flp pilus assembly protein TadG
MTRPTDDTSGGAQLEVRRHERGSVGPFILLLMPALIGLAGLAYDGGMLFAGRREANILAAAAARAGTNDLDESSIYAGDPVMAGTAPGSAVNFAYSQGADTASASVLDPKLLKVTVTRQVDLLFLSMFGLGTQTVHGSGTSHVVPGVTG